MDSARWQQVSELLGEVIELDRKKRERVLAERCADDPELLSEIESLLDADASASEPPEFGRELVQQPLPDVEGFKIEESIDVGGMGAVFRARQLDPPRLVALKVVRSALGSPDALARFDSERALLARLSHPNIATVFSAGSTRDGSPYFAMEFVDGPSVRSFAAGRRLDLRGRLRLGIEICDALDHAHARGVVHRDLKPSNILVADRDGTPTVKVIDFGVAKLLGTNLEGPGRLTRTGQIIGTPEAMSPEQARGQNVDARTDLWSLGCVLFELVSGSSPFRRGTVGDTLAAILKEPPDWSLLPDETPPALRRLLRRCLTKNPSARLRSAADARLELLDAEQELQAESVSATKARTRLTGSVVLGVVLGLALGLGLFRILAPASSTRSDTESRFRVHIPGLRTNERLAPVLSPDGERFVYGRDGLLWIRNLNVLEPTPLMGTEGAEYPFWSPDGQSVGYFADGVIRRIDRDGSDATNVIDLRGDVIAGAGAAWMPDDTIVYSRGNTDLYAVPARGGERIVYFAATPDVGLHFHRPRRITGHDALVFGIHRAVGADTIAVLRDGELRIVLQADRQRVDSPVWSPRGYVLFERKDSNAGLWAVSFDPQTMVAGEPFFVAAGGGRPTVADDGTLMYQPGVVAGEVQLGWVDRSGTWLGAVGDRERDIRHPRLSNDESRAVISVRRRDDLDVFRMDLASGLSTPLTFDTGLDQNLPHWSPDGRSIVVTENRLAEDGTMDPRLWIAEIDGGRRSELFLGWDACFTRDGRDLVFVSNAQDIAVAPADGSAEPSLILDSSLEEREPELSPDNRLMAYWTNPDGIWSVVLTRFPEATGTWRVSPDGGGKPRWNGNGDRLFYTHRNRIYEVEVQYLSEVRVGSPVELFSGDRADLDLELGYDVTDDGRRFLVVRNLFADRGRDEEAVLLLNWSGEEP